MKQIYTGIGIINRRHDCEYNRSSASSPQNSCVLKGTYLYRIKQVNIADCTDPFGRRIT